MNGSLTIIHCIYNRMFVLSTRIYLVPATGLPWTTMGQVQKDPCQQGITGPRGRAPWTGVPGPRRRATGDRRAAHDDKPGKLKVAHNPLGGDLRHVLVSTLPRAASGESGVAPGATARSRARPLGCNSESGREPRPARMTNIRRGATVRRLRDSLTAASRWPPRTEALCVCTSSLEPPIGTKDGCRGSRTKCTDASVKSPGQSAKEQGPGDGQRDYEHDHEGS
jgi:hypothetical protein